MAITAIFWVLALRLSLPSGFRRVSHTFILYRGCHFLFKFSSFVLVLVFAFGLVWGVCMIFLFLSLHHYILALILSFMLLVLP